MKGSPPKGAPPLCEHGRGWDDACAACKKWSSDPGPMQQAASELARYTRRWIDRGMPVRFIAWTMLSAATMLLKSRGWSLGAIQWSVQSTWDEHGARPD